MLKKTKQNTIILSGLFYLWTGFIFLACVTPGKALEPLNFWNIFTFDKFIHMVIFFFLAFFQFLYLNQKEWQLKNNITACLIFGVIYGIVLELIQHYFIPSRFGDFSDITANTIGTIAGVAVCLYIVKTPKALS